MAGLNACSVEDLFRASNQYATRSTKHIWIALFPWWVELKYRESEPHVRVGG
jgi:hypothetical protein